MKYILLSRGLKEKDFVKIAQIIDKTFKNGNKEEILDEVNKITTKYPLWYK